MQELVDALRVKVLRYRRCVVFSETQTSHQMRKLLFVYNSVPVGVNLLELLNKERKELLMFP